ncbi:hypothetical protein KIPB_007132 [Kipferlia bialata]|uniref:Uncharacterized protein n=1 Tax=Kipferlia bialata TaxID=797122 RepID=A0A9K3D0C3_9EUKA|nr:hypothetical protein KIPB_007132 [Kipferlia bialata]|eukprot:g7132.t1
MLDSYPSASVTLGEGASTGYLPYLDVPMESQAVFEDKGSWALVVLQCGLEEEQTLTVKGSITSSLSSLDASVSYLPVPLRKMVPISGTTCIVILAVALIWHVLYRLRKGHEWHHSLLLFGTYACAAGFGIVFVYLKACDASGQMSEFGVSMIGLVIGLSISVGRAIILVLATGVGVGRQDIPGAWRRSLFLVLLFWSSVYTVLQMLKYRAYGEMLVSPVSLTFPTDGPFTYQDDDGITVLSCILLVPEIIYDVYALYVVYCVKRDMDTGRVRTAGTAKVIETFRTVSACIAVWCVLVMALSVGCVIGAALTEYTETFNSSHLPFAFYSLSLMVALIMALVVWAPRSMAQYKALRAQRNRGSGVRPGGRDTPLFRDPLVSDFTIEGEEVDGPVL